MNRRHLTAGSIAVLALLAPARTGTGGSSGGADAEAPGDPANVSGTITVLTHRTDLVQDGTTEKYAAEFNRTHPKVKAEFDGLTDYEGEVKIRMNTEDCGDVLMIPAVVRKKDCPRSFASLGSQEELSEKYRFTGCSTGDGKVHGQSPIGVVPGVVYNKRVRRQAGVTDWPTAPAEFLDDPKAVKARTGAGPYYTNFQDGGTLDSVLGPFGYDGDRAWLGTSTSAGVALAGVSVWRCTGLNFVLLLGAVQSVPGELYEAAELAGANRWQQFRYIIAPSIRPVIGLTVILSVPGSLPVFEIPYVMTGGATGTETFVIQTVKLAFQFNTTGLASAAAVVLLLIVLAVTRAQRRLVPDDPERKAEPVRPAEPWPAPWCTCRWPSPPWSSCCR